MTELCLCKMVHSPKTPLGRSFMLSAKGGPSLIHMGLHFYF